MTQPSLANADLGGAMQALVPPELRSLGWRYVDPPTKFSHEMWDYFRALIGEGEYRILISSAGTSPDGFRWKRGQFLISPQGMKNLVDKERAKKLASTNPTAGAS